MFGQTGISQPRGSQQMSSLPTGAGEGDKVSIVDLLQFIGMMLLKKDLEHCDTQRWNDGGGSGSPVYRLNVRLGKKIEEK